MNSLHNIFDNERLRFEDTENISKIWYNKGRVSIQYIGTDGTLTVLFKPEENSQNIHYRTDEANNQGIGVSVASISKTSNGALKYDLPKDGDGQCFLSKIPKHFQDIALDYIYNRDAIGIDKENDNKTKKKQREADYER